MLFKVQSEWRDVKLQDASVVYVECCSEAADERSKQSLIMNVQQVGPIHGPSGVPALTFSTGTQNFGH